MSFHLTAVDAKDEIKVRTAQILAVVHTPNTRPTDLQVFHNDLLYSAWHSPLIVHAGSESDP